MISSTPTSAHNSYKRSRSPRAQRSKSSHSLMLVFAGVISGLAPAQSEDPAVVEAKAYNSDGLYGARYAFSWSYENWSGPLVEDNQIGPDPIGAQLAPLLDAAPGLDFDVNQVAVRINNVTVNCPRDAERKWAFDMSSRVVLRFDDCYRTEYVHDGGSIFSYGDDTVCLSGAPQLDLLTLGTNNRSGMGVKSLGANVMYPLPESPVLGGTWLQTTSWSSSVGMVNGIQRVRLSAVNGFNEDPSAVYVLLFERQAGTLVPIVQYQSDSFGVGVTSFSYVLVNHPQGGQVPFPAARRVIERGEDLSLNIEVGGFQVLPAPTSRNELRISIKQECMLSVHNSALSTQEVQTVLRADITTWPIRVLNAIVVL